MFFAELSQDGEDETTATEFEAEVLKDGLDGFAHTVLYTLYDT
jgi:hypothetical protein